MSVAIKTGSHIEVGIPMPLLRFPRRSFPDFSIAPTGDGQRFLVIEGAETDPQAQITLVLNWAAELKQKERQDRATLAFARGSWILVARFQKTVICRVY